MTALERADAAVTEWLHADHSRKSLRDAIHRACIKHSNAELERRRKAEARLRAAIDALEEIESGSGQCHSGHGGCDAACKAYARRALKALEGGDVAPFGIWRCSCCGERKPDTIDASWRWNGRGWEHAHGQAGHFEAARNFEGDR